MNNKLFDLIGSIPGDKSEFKKRVRFHQGWWRTFVLNEPPGPHPMDKNGTVCNTISNGKTTFKNLISKNCSKAIEETKKQQAKYASGILEENRLYNNLLSSQPLCFNFFGELMFNKALATKILKRFFPIVESVEKVVFEYAPAENYLADNSAYDVAFIVRSCDDMGLIGLECKFTDTFSTEKYSKASYKQIYSNSKIFKKPYVQYTVSKYNQLFRNELIAESAIQNNKFKFVHTGLFCHPSDFHAIRVASEFQQMLHTGVERFKVITYDNYLTELQKMDLNWEMREWTMMLWARYLATNLSKNLFEQL